MADYLRTKQGKIISGPNKVVNLRGVNLGGWLMMEAYFMHAPNLPERHFRNGFTRRLGAKAMDAFDRSFRKNFIRKEDIRRIARLGFNCIRVPFHYRLIEKAPFQYEKSGVRILDHVLRWAQEHKIWVILDLHAAPGCQNHDWHSDSFGQADFWKRKTCQQRVINLWQFLADRYKNEKYLAGYDLLNESVLRDKRLLNSVYKRIIKAIRAVDKNHILFIEGNTWAQDIGSLDVFDDPNYVLSIHNYEPLDFTFNFVPHLKYPVRSAGVLWNKDIMRRRLLLHANVAKKHGVPVFVGEFGVNARMGLFGEHKWLEDTLSCYQKFGFHWTYWTYKAVKNSAFPDGIFSFVDNPPWVHRSGPRLGWETFADHWPKHKRAMMRSWQTDQFQVNTPILKTLQNALK